MRNLNRNKRSLWYAVPVGSAPILDEYGNIVTYAQLPVKLQLEGAAELVGPDVVTAEGGMTGTYIRTLGRTGEARLTIRTEQTEDVTLIFKISAG